MQIKTITTVAGVNEIDFGNDDSQTTAHFYWFKNLSDSTLYVSAQPNPIAGEDNVAELSAKGAASVETDEGKVYVLGAGKVEIHRTNSKFCPFELPSTGSGGGGSITVDSELSETSENPLQNKATTAAINEVKSELNTKSDVNHIHDITASGNPVTLTNLQGEVPFSEIVVSGKNLLKYPYADTTKTVNGITFTDNGDSTITANGTATAISSFALIWKNFYLPKGIYTISGSPEGGDVNTGFYAVCGTDTVRFATDTGNGGTFSIIDDINDFTFSLRINSGVTVDNIVFRPQLELGDTATTYEPPITGRELQVNASGKNLIGIAQAKALTGDITQGFIVLGNSASRSIIQKLQPNTTYHIKKYDSGNRFRIVMFNNEPTNAADTTAIQLIYNSDGSISDYTLTTGEDHLWMALATNYAESGEAVEPIVQLELGDTATEYEPYHGSTTTITPDSNPYVIPNDIRQQDGLNNISVSAGELSVVGVQKNAAIKRIWDDMRMDLLFDGVTSADNPAVVNLANYNMIRIDVSGNYAGTTYFNCGSTYLSKSTLDFAFESYGRAAIPASSQAVVINISKSGAEYSLSFSGFNEKQLIDDIKIYGIK